MKMQWGMEWGSVAAIASVLATGCGAEDPVGDAPSSNATETLVGSAGTGGGPPPPGCIPSGIVSGPFINEIGANEPGSDTAAEFIEVVSNRSSSSVPLCGWTLSDSTGVRHTFGTGTFLGPGKAIVVFGASSAIPAGLTNAVAASTGALSLSNSGDTVVLKAPGVTVESVTYPATLADSDGVSMNRKPDAFWGGFFVKHNTLTALPSSPGKRSNGSDW
jgi:hypothetical protein